MSTVFQFYMQLAIYYRFCTVVQLIGLSHLMYNSYTYDITIAVKCDSSFPYNYLFHGVFSYIL